tara:strand:- start:690 stop:1394 length:705 start_codon:yes stop_codon:yes gene_type:complete
LTNSYSADYFLNGQVLLIDKPLTWTSFDAVNKIRYNIRKEYNIRKIKVGHAGTLDPLATGLLIICTGRFTKKINEYMGLPKEYTGSIQLGASTPSYDLETQIDHNFPVDHINQSLVDSIKGQFLGSIEQIPPVFSAIKKDGEKAYEAARRGESIEMKSRSIEIMELELSLKDNHRIDFRVKCSKGTYIRSLAHDIGKALNSGAHLSELRRTKIGDFNVDNAMNPDEFLKEISQS